MAKDSIIKKIMNFLWEYGAVVIIFIDNALDRLEEIFKTKILPFGKETYREIRELLTDGLNFLFDIGATIVIWWDKTADIIEWFITKIYVICARNYHELRLKTIEHKKELLRHGALILVVGVGVIAIFASAVDYEYSYNGRPLGIVKEQRDVLEILDLVSEELSNEYGSNITIDPETDISFRPVVSIGKDKDEPDTVLRRFTYMGDIQVKGVEIVADGKRIALLENEEKAKEVLEQVKEMYLTKDSKKYEYVGFMEDVKIKPFDTILARINNPQAALKKIKSGGQQEVKYKVVAGDTLYSICYKLNISMEELKALNPSISDTMVLHVGDEFLAKKEIPLLTVKTVEVSSFAEKTSYKVIYKHSDKYYKNDRIVKQKGAKGKAKITARLTRANGEVVKRVNIRKDVIKEAVDKIVIIGTRKEPVKAGTGSFIRPVNTGVIAGYGMRWGRMHYGLDYAAPVGTPIHAADGGTVVGAGSSGAYGYLITINHGNGFETLYAHCSSMRVHIGEKVFKGQIIGGVGSTGRSTGPHCHFEIKINGKNVNPASYV